MDDRLNLGSEVRELKLGTTFNNHHSSGTSFHTLKYDFKPASVDLNKEASVEVSPNNQVIVTVPHQVGSGVPKTVFKGNQKKYTKECVLIIDKITGEITLEKLSNNITVKKTRSENVSKNGAMPPAMPNIKLNENNTQRTSTKTKVSTGVRKTNNITGFVPRHSPLQGSPSYPHHKSPQSAPAWNANNGQSTLPSIPIIDDDVIAPMPVPVSNPEPQLLPQTASSLPSSLMTSSHHQQQQHHHNHHNHHHHSNDVGEIMSSSDSSDSESSESESDSDNNAHSPEDKRTGAALERQLMNGNNMSAANILKEDLCLSESGDSDDD